MANFDLIHIKCVGLTDSGLHCCNVRLGFWDDDLSVSPEIDVTVYIEADLDASLRELREQAKVAALSFLQKAGKLLEQHSTDELHQAAKDQSARQDELENKRGQEQLARSLEDAGLG